jgi:hypothetical protein
MATRASAIRASTAFFGWTWSPVLAGVFTSLVVQILLTMLGFGVGLLAVDAPTAASAPAGATHWAFVWWAVSGIIAAFAGGAVAAANAPDQSSFSRVGHAMAAWAVTTVLVVMAGAMTAGASLNVASNLAGPSYAATARLAAVSQPAARETTGAATAAQARPTPAQVDAARKHFAYVMLASFFALLLGVGASYAAGRFMTGEMVRDAAEPIT